MIEDQVVNGRNDNETNVAGRIAKNKNWGGRSVHTPVWVISDI